MMKEQNVGEIPDYIQTKINEVITILAKQGISYQNQLIAQKIHDPTYGFFYPKSPYYRYYISKLAHIDSENFTSNQTVMPIEEEKSFLIEGTLEDMSVGAMCQLIKNHLRKEQISYQPFDEEFYSHEITKHVNQQEMNNKVNKLMTDINFIVSESINKGQQAQDKKQKQNVSMIPNKKQTLRMQMAIEKDGSLGAWGGKKFQGLGSRDAFSQFRRERSQQYRGKLQEKRYT